MHIPLHYTYFVGSLIASLPWLFIFFLRKDLRREMMIMSLLFMVFAVAAEYFLWTVDYWRPVTIEGTRIGIEDFILGFTNGGIIAVCYEFFFRKNHQRAKFQHNNKGTVFAVSLTIVLLAVLFWGFHIKSSIATPISLLLGTLFMLWQRKDLVLYSLFSGLIATIGSLPFYFLLEYLTPNFVERTWLLAQLTGITILGIPLEDIMYYFAIGCFLGTVYLFWSNEVIDNSKNYTLEAGNVGS